MDEEEDPIISEIPVFCSKQLGDNVYVFQYPTISRKHQVSSQIQKALFRPENQQAKLEMTMHTESQGFDLERAEAVAKRIEAASESQKSTELFENGMVDKLMFSSRKLDENVGNYALAAFNGTELHLTPIKGILQMLPDHSYLDKLPPKSNKRAAGNKANKFEISEKDFEEAGPSKEPEQIRVKFKQAGGSKKVENATNAPGKDANEPWIECAWFESGTPTSNVEKLKVYAANTHPTEQAISLSDEEYIRLLVPQGTCETAEPALPSHVVPLQVLRALPIHEQCRHLLKHAKIMQFQHMQMLLAGSKGFTTDSLLKTLQKLAVLVKGNWVVKSEVLYPKDTFSSTSGVPAEMMCRARDYVLYLFTKNDYVERKKISSIMKVPSEEIKEIFTGISKLKHNKGWSLKNEPDYGFIYKNGELVKEQTRLWEEWFKNHIEAIVAANNEKRQRRKSKSVSISEDVPKKNGQLPNSSSGTDDSGSEKGGKAQTEHKKHKRQKTS